MKYACFLSTGGVKQIIRMDQIVYAFINAERKPIRWNRADVWHKDIHS